MSFRKLSNIQIIHALRNIRQALEILIKMRESGYTYEDEMRKFLDCVNELEPLGLLPFSGKISRRVLESFLELPSPLLLRLPDGRIPIPRPLKDTPIDGLISEWLGNFRQLVAELEHRFSEKTDEVAGHIISTDKGAFAEMVAFYWLHNVLGKVWSHAKCNVLIYMPDERKVAEIDVLAEEKSGASVLYYAAEVCMRLTIDDLRQAERVMIPALKYFLKNLEQTQRIKHKIENITFISLDTIPKNEFENYVNTSSHFKGIKIDFYDIEDIIRICKENERNPASRRVLDSLKYLPNLRDA